MPPSIKADTHSKFCEDCTMLKEQLKCINMNEESLFKLLEMLVNEDEDGDEDLNLNIL